MQIAKNNWCMAREMLPRRYVTQMQSIYWHPSSLFRCILAVLLFALWLIYQEEIHQWGTSLIFRGKAAKARMFRSINISFFLSRSAVIHQRKLWPRRLFQIWNDYKLQWMPVEFDGIEFIRVPSNKIWRPDIVLYNKWDSSRFSLACCLASTKNYDSPLLWGVLASSSLLFGFLWARLLFHHCRQPFLSSSNSYN